MSETLVSEAFRHHVWATLRLIDACTQLTDEQLGSSVAGTYGSILETMRHLVSADSWYIFDTSGGAASTPKDDELGLRELRSTMEQNGKTWSELLAADHDPQSVLTEVDDSDGFERDASIGIRLAQALHHGTDHRSQICTALTALGISPPSIDVWAYGLDMGSVVERSGEPRTAG